jgi:hypothetical protein
MTNHEKAGKCLKCSNSELNEVNNDK